MNLTFSPKVRAWLLFAAMATLATAIYASGLRGGYIFDDFPNIVDNEGVRPPDASIPSLVRSALSSPASEFKRPLSSLSFAVNYLATGDDPTPMKVTNLVIHLLNGFLVFLLARRLVRLSGSASLGIRASGEMVAALIAGLWLLLPINLTSVLYIVQRMESLANLFVLLGLLAYVEAREHMQASSSSRWPIYAVFAVGLCTLVGLLAKETAVMLPMYAFVIELLIFGFRSLRRFSSTPVRDFRIFLFYGLLLALPVLVGLCWLMPTLLSPAAWMTRDFTLGTRLLTELRVITAYIGWTLLPTPAALSFYHDDLTISVGLLSPLSTLVGGLALAGLGALAWLTRRSYPLVTLGLMLFGSAHLLTGTILPLELAYEHRNYFASMGLLIAVIPVLASGRDKLPGHAVRLTLIGALVIHCSAVLYVTAHAWNNPLSLAEELGDRGPRSPRAQYELGRTYIIASRYDPRSPFTALAYPPLERAAKLPGASILPEQALMFLNARLHQPVKDAWWESMIHKLATRKVTVQDESALGALAGCMRQGLCNLPAQRMTDAFLAAIGHQAPSARLLAMYSDFAWTTLGDRDLGLRMAIAAMNGDPREPVYRITVVKLLVAMGRSPEAAKVRDGLLPMNVGGSLNDDIASLNRLLAGHE